MAPKKASKAEARLKIIQTLRDSLLEFAIEAEGEENLTRDDMIEMRENLLEVADVLLDDLRFDVNGVNADGSVSVSLTPDWETF